MIAIAQIEGPGNDDRCHCEERSDVAIRSPKAPLCVSMGELSRSD